VAQCYLEYIKIDNTVNPNYATLLRLPAWVGRVQAGRTWLVVSKTVYQCHRWTKGCLWIFILSWFFCSVPLESHRGVPLSKTGLHHHASMRGKSVYNFAPVALW